jgi:hypothetical protein
MKTPEISKNCLFIVAALLTAVITSGCASPALVTSTGKPKDITIDGSITDWKSIPLYLDNSSGLGIRICHDSDAMYLALSASGRNLQMALLRGVTVWFDRNGGDDKVFGVHVLPPRADEGNMRRESRTVMDRTGRMPITPITDVEVVRPKTDERYRVPVGNNSGIQVAMGTSDDGILTMEMKVPFAKSAHSPDAVEWAGSTAVGIGIVSGSTGSQGDMPVQGGAGGGPPGMPHGGMGSDGGPMSGGGPPSGGPPSGGPPSGGPPSGAVLQQASIDLWLKVMIGEH